MIEFFKLLPMRVFAINQNKDLPFIYFEILGRFALQISKRSWEDLHYKSLRDLWKIFKKELELDQKELRSFRDLKYTDDLLVFVLIFNFEINLRNFVK